MGKKEKVLGLEQLLEIVVVDGARVSEFTSLYVLSRQSCMIQQGNPQQTEKGIDIMTIQATKLCNKE